MENLDIVPASAEHYTDILKIFNECFFPKFLFVDKQGDRIKDIIHDFGIVDIATRDLVHVAILEDKVLGVLVLDWIEHSTIRQPTNIPFFRLLKKYGIRRLIRMTRLGKIFKHIPDEDEVYIDSLGVSSEARGMGIGTRLIEYACDYAKKGAYARVTLDVAKENLNAKKLYEREGFKEVSFRDVPELKDFGFSGAHFMAKTLG